MQVAQFLVSCNQWREASCLSCVTFKSSVEILIKTLDSDGKNYVQNFKTDFLKLSNKLYNIQSRNKFYRKQIKTKNF